MTRALIIAALIAGIAAAAQAGAPTFSPVPVPHPTMGCDTRDYIIAKLTGKYGEVRRGAGLSGPTAIYEIWASDATGTWTILKITPDGLACIMAVGDGWQDDSLKELTGDWL